ncbi:MAG: hypothetical protein IKL89_02715 [Clostridia bacterium]|nr:hypothetical protein [Clostridia bacterium]
MEKKKLAVVAMALAITVVCLAAAIVAAVPAGELPPAESEPAPAAETVFVRLTGKELGVYFGGRTAGLPDARFPVDTAPLSGEDVLRLSAGMDLADREEYLMLLESLGIG